VSSSWLPAARLEQRLDAGFYADEYLKNEDAMLASGVPMRTVGEVSAKCNCGATPKKVSYGRTGTLLVRGADIRASGLQVDQIRRAEGLDIDPDSNVAALPGDLVYTMSGASLGDAAVIPDLHREYSFTNTVVRARLKPGHDSGFVAAFFNCRHGRTNSTRHSSGGDRGHVMPNVFRRLLVPAPHPHAQAYVGSLGETAQRLKSWAMDCVRRLDDSYRPFAMVLAERRHHSRVSPLQIRERLDAGHYPHDVSQAVATSTSGPLARLDDITEAVFAGATLARSEQGVPARQATVANLDRVYLKGDFRTVRSPKSQRRRFRNGDLAIAAAAHSATYIGRDVTYVMVNRPVFPSTEVLVVRPDAELASGAWVWCVLRSAFGYRQIQSCVRGITAHAYPDDLRDIVVPVPPPSVRETFAEFDRQIQLGARMVSAAGALLDSSRMLVEALIERKVTEAELIAAHRDPAADRALLSRLTDTGLDGDGDPVFPDLDALAELLEEATSGADT